MGKKKALLLGAGFSYDLGMPLANGLTKDLFHFLIPERLEKYIKIWKLAEPYGVERPIDPKVIDEVKELYLLYRSKEDSNYEEFLKEIQNEYHKLGASQIRRDTLHFVFGRFFEMIVQMFWMYQANNFNWYLKNREFYYSFSKFVPVDEEVWVVSLNHDLFIELLCIELDIPISFGSNGTIDIPESNINLQQRLTFESIERINMNLNNMQFIRNNRGVNLIKLHGGINEFSFDDDSKVLQIAIEKGDTSFSYLYKTQKALHELKYLINGEPAKISREIAVSDLQGKMQFLRKSILTGGYKYSETFNPKPGEEKMQLMEEVLETVDEITIIGYGFGDEHVNLRLYNAMLLNKELSIVIVDPYRRDIPKILKPFDYKMRVRMARCGGPEWLSYVEKERWDKELMNGLKENREIRALFDMEYRNRFLSPKIYS